MVDEQSLPSAIALELPSLLERRFEPLSFLGKGSFGSVYKCRDKQSGLLVALKVITPTIGNELSAYSRLRREMEAASRISHGNVARFIEGFLCDGAPAYSMEFVEGRPLRSLITTGSPMSLVKALLLGTQILRGVEAIHEQGLVHRDLKPENILVADGDMIKITDFGLAHLVVENGIAIQNLTPEEFVLYSTGESRTIGTPDYMSPEALATGCCSKQSDVYAVGAILYELLTGAVPFAHLPPQEMLTAKLSTLPPPPHEVRPECPERLSNIILRALAPSPQSRYQSIYALQFDLHALISDHSQLFVDVKLFHRLSFDKIPLWRYFALICQTKLRTARHLASRIASSIIDWVSANFGATLPQNTVVVSATPGDRHSFGTLALMSWAAVAAMLITVSTAGVPILSASPQPMPTYLANHIHQPKLIIAEDANAALNEKPTSTDEQQALEQRPSTTVAQISLRSFQLKRLQSSVLLPLHEAASRCDSAQVARELEAGAAINNADALGETALIKAVKSGCASLVSILLANGADPTIRAENGFRAVDFVKQETDPTMRRVLVRAFAEHES